MARLPINEADFNLPFELVYDDISTDLYAPLHLAIRDALGLGADVEPKYTSSGGAIEPRPLVKGKLYKGAGRINGVTGTPYEGKKAASVSYSVIWTDQGEIVRWSIDLDDAPYGYKKPATLWFRQDGQPVLLTDALRAAVKALAPRKTRAKKTP